MKKGGLLFSCLWLTGALVAQGDPFEQVELRVASAQAGGRVVVDRGARDQVEIDDRVVLMPRGAGTQAGRVVQVEQRTALVQLLDPRANVPAGTRGHVLIPKARLAPAAPPEQPAVPSDEQEPADDEWRPGMPLLGRHRAPRPEERSSRVRGRVYGTANLVRTLDSFSQSFVTTGADMDINNIAGNGGVLRFHGEFNRSKEFSGQVGNDIRVYRLSYEHGGTRFDPVRWQVGRFLPSDMPEFGLLDGIEVGYRTEGGDRFGASFGYLPELDDDMESLADLQVAAWYVWNQDVGERVSFGLGYQRTWHRFESDRDLIVAKMRILPDDGWDLSSAVWVDLYDGDDDLKDENFEVTRANVFASRRVQGEGGVEFFYDHEEYPELLRQEIQQTLLPATLIDAHVDRVSARLWLHSSPTTQWFTRLTGYADEEGEGGAAELGFSWFESVNGGARSGLALFHMDSLFSTVTGVRVEHGGTYGFGRVDLLYELGYVAFDDRPPDQDELVQHRFGALLTTDLGSGWDATFNVDATFWDEESSFGVGIYLQRLF